MKRRRSSAPGWLRPDIRWTSPILLAPLVLLLLVACGQATSTDQPSASPADPSGAVPSVGVPVDPSSDPPTDTPTATAEQPATPEPTTTEPGTPSAEPSPGSGSAASCSGSDENRDFFASMAAAVDWTVYCPVLPDGWFVDDGQYRLAGGGWMDISYDGPGAARITLRQGAICGTGDGCVPAGSDIGDTAFGDRTGTLVAMGDGGWAVVVDRGATPSWLLVVEGLSEPEAREIASSLHAIAD